MAPPKSTSFRQLELLFELLSRHTDLAKGRVRSKEERIIAGRFWAEVANVLNNEIDGSCRTPKEWSTYYNDFKCRLKRKVRDKYSESRAEGSEIVHLSGLEERYATLLFPEELGPMPVKQNPDDESDDEQSFNWTEHSNDLETKPQQPSTSGVQPHRECRTDKSSTTDELEKIKNTLTEIEMARIKLDMERNDIKRKKLIIEGKKVAAINNLAQAAWALVSTFSEGESRKRPHPSSDNEDGT